MKVLSNKLGSCLLGLLLTGSASATSSVFNQPSFVMPVIASSSSILSEEQLLTPEEQAATQKMQELNKRAYTLVYSNKTKGPSLESTTIKGQVFQGGKPISYFEVKTNEEGKFAFEKDYGKNAAIDLFHVAGQEKMKVSCQGSGVPGSQEVKISCTPSNRSYTN